MSHYIVHHNVTDVGDLGIVVNDTSVKIHVSNDQISSIAVYWIQVAAVNAIGQGPVRETILCKALQILLTYRLIKIMVF